MKTGQRIIMRYSPGGRGEETDASENTHTDTLSITNPFFNINTSYGSFHNPKNGVLQYQDAVASKAKKKTKTARLVMHVGNTKYAVIKHVGKTVFGYKLTKSDDSAWDLYWTDTYVPIEIVSKMRGCQRINHFPGMEGLARKNLLSNNLTKIRRYLPGEYGFYPKTWLLPSDTSSLYKEFHKRGTSCTLIAKPEASCQGRGIFLTKTLDDFKEDERYVVQKYLEHPLLIDGLKFDMRIYVLLAGCDPLRIYVYEKGIARFATVPYEKPSASNLDKLFMHLTNYAVNKKSGYYKCVGEGENSTTGHKRCLSFIWSYLDSNGFNSASIRKEINEIIIKTICSIQPVLSHLLRTTMNAEFTNKSCFEILGFDIILDETGKPWLLEINHSPSFATETKFDWNLKHGLIKDTLQIVMVSQRAKNSFLWKQIQDQKRRLLGKAEKTKNVRKIPMSKRIGGYELIYPCGDTRYEKHICAAAKVWTEFTQGKKLAAKIIIPGTQPETELNKLAKEIENASPQPKSIRSRSVLKISSKNYISTSGNVKRPPGASPNKNRSSMNRSALVMRCCDPAIDTETTHTVTRRKTTHTLSLFIKNVPINPKPPSQVQIARRPSRLQARSQLATQTVNLSHLYPLLDSDVELMKIQHIGGKKDNERSDYSAEPVIHPRKNTIQYRKSGLL